MLSPAPYHAQITNSPAPQAHWTRADDGVRLRIGVWDQGDKGTIILFPGRTEYIEKYANAAAQFQAAGFAVAAIDWRGQGLSDRLIPNSRLGHIGDFADYQRDVAAMMAAVAELNLPRPHHLVAHSMGGCIGLRALINGLDIERVVFSAPMWGIVFDPKILYPLARGISAMAHPLGLGHLMVPGASSTAFPASDPFEGNKLTSDPDMYEWICNQVTMVPELGVGGPTLGWIRAALHEMRALSMMPAPNYPALCFLGARERIVTPAAIRHRMADWKGGELHEALDTRHEIMMETPQKRAMFFDKTIQFLKT